MRLRAARRRARGALARSLCGVLLVATTAHAAGATGAPAPLAALLAAFDRTYLPSDFAYLTHAEATVTLRGAELRGLPSVGLSESLTWHWSGGSELTVGADLSVPVYSTLAPLEVEQARAGLAAAALELEAERGSQRAAFLSDLYAAALFDRALRDLATALERLRSVHPGLPSLTGGGPGSGAAELFTAASDTRALIELVAAATELRSHLSAQLDLISRRVARAAGDATWPPVGQAGWEALADALATAVPRAVPSEEACLASAPTAQLARARYRQAQLAAQAGTTPQLRVQLSASASYSNLGGVSGGAALSAELTAPAAWALSGSGGLEADLAGVTQRLQLRWPARPTLAGPPRTAESALALALDDVLAARRAATEAVAQAAQHRELSALRLAWFARDALGLPPDVASVALLAAADARFPDPVAGLQAAELRARLAFAELSVALARIELASLCGWQP